jgi:hypothetical protein
MKRNLLLLLFLFSAHFSHAQDDLLGMLQTEGSDDAIKNTFKSTMVVNAQTNETVAKRVLDFRITHRFGNMGTAAGGGPHSLWGFDHASNIRFSFDYGITDDLQVGIGRSKMREHIDGNIKYRLLQQTEQKIPISVTLYSIAAFTPERDVTDRYKKAAHRFSYVHQMIIARKFGDKFSFAVLPTFVHRNLVDNEANPGNEQPETNDFFSLGFAGRFKLTHRTVLVADYFRNFSPYRYDNPRTPYFNPLSVGLEIETGGHVFHVNVSNSAGIIENDFLPYTRDNWLDGGFKLGFHISRVFQF